MRWFRRRPTRHVTLYGKPNCHLCDDAKHLLDRLGKRYPVTVVEKDITLDPALYREYDVRIPVIVFDSGDLLEAPIYEHDVRRLLQSPAAGNP
ncbi:MAG: NrdH-redoxin [Chloroflexi bacterium]|nr:MAG: NrdH-redoxin [Chloroflexota bacterium]